MNDDLRPETDQTEPEPDESARPELEGPTADAIAAEEASKAAASDTFEQAIDVPDIPDFSDDAVEVSKPSGQLERLQKILARAGIASRRHAEELITGGRVQVNGKVVTELGSKADAARDHIRVDGKLLQGSERLRYFMLNKPKGFVTTVSDPEGRPTIMEFFSKMRERLYPVGRLDYLSEGLLLVTNDGELANKLTRAASGVEKTYLVKVSGEPSEGDIDRLREGIGIDRGKPGSGRVQTAPAEIRKVRQGENPWYEVVLIEGRNRELRKMFESIGHHVEKIRRVGYGPLVLDLEPGKLRELEAEEIENLRKAAEGKYHKPKARENRRQFAKDRFSHDKKQPWKQHRGDAGQTRNRQAREDSGRSGGFRSGSGQRPPSGRSRNFERGSSGQRHESGGSRGSERRPGQRPPSGGSRNFERGPGQRVEPGRSRGFDRGSGQRPASGGSREFERRPERGEFRTAGRGKFHPGGRPRLVEDQPQRPPRPQGPPSGIDQERGFGQRRFAGRQSRESATGPARSGPRPLRREFRGAEESSAGQPKRRPFQGRPAGRQGFRKDRGEQPRFGHEREGGKRGEERQARPERPQSGSRPSFKQGKRGPSPSNRGSIRSGVGRRPGSRSRSKRKDDDKRRD